MRVSNRACIALVMLSILSSAASAGDAAKAPEGLNIGRGRRAAVEATAALAAGRAARSAEAKAEAERAAAKKAEPGTSSAAEPTKAAAKGPSAAETVAALRASSSGGKATGALLVRSAVDERGDAEKEYLDIVRADLGLFADRLVIGISFASFPAKIPFDSKALEADAQEYEWSCALDIEGDGKDDYFISLFSFKDPKAGPSEAAVTARCKANLWKATETGAEMVEADVGAEASDSAIYFTLADGRAFPLRLVTKSTKFTAKTYYDGGKGGTEDYLAF